MIKRIVLDNHDIYNSNGSLAGTLNGEYEASTNEGQQPNWYALREVVGGVVQPEIVANVHGLTIIT